MGLYKRGGAWWMRFTVGGRQERHPTGTADKKLAQRILAKAQAMVAEGRWFADDGSRDMTFDKMAKRYLTSHEKGRDRRTLRRLMPTFGGELIASVRPHHVEEYRQHRLRSVKPATVYQDLSLMRRMYNVARREWGMDIRNPLDGISFSVGNSNARDRWLTPEEEARLLECCGRPAWLRPMVTLALHTGMRQGEILELRWPEVDLDRRVLVVSRSKNGDRRGIPLSATATEALKAFRGERKVVDISGRAFPVSTSSVRQAFLKALGKAGIEDFRFHDLRHTFATRLVQAGVDLYRVQRLLGHRTVAMTARYAHHGPESLRSSVNALDELAQN